MNKTVINRTSGYQAVRTHAGWIDFDPLHCVFKISGSQALEALDHYLPGKLLFSSLTTLFLDEEIKIRDLVQVINLEDHYLLIGSRSVEAEILNAFGSGSFQGEFKIESLSSSHSIVGVEGPYSWYVLNKIYGTEILGLRVHSVMSLSTPASASICIRSGVSGEYAYKFIVDRSFKSQLIEELNSISLLPTVETSDIALLCQETRIPVFQQNVYEGECPFELGLRYMIDFQKDSFVFAEQLKAKSEVSERTLVAFKVSGSNFSLSEADVGKPLLIEGKRRGTVRNLFFSPALNTYCGYALVDSEFGYPSFSNDKLFELTGQGVTTVSMPILQTLSSTVVME